MSGRPQGSLERAARTVVVGTIKATRARDAREAQVKFEEVDLEAQIRIEGVAGGLVGGATEEIAFDYDFFYAPGQRDSELTRPHFTFGAECDADVQITAHVREWTRNENNDAYTGAQVRICVTGDENTHYSGMVHVTFHGWGALREDDGNLG